MATPKSKRRTASPKAEGRRVPSREESLQIQHIVMKKLMEKPGHWADVDCLWFRLCDCEVYADTKKKSFPSYPYAWLSLRDFHALLKELFHQNVLDIDHDHKEDMKIRSKGSIGNSPSLEEKK